MIRRVLTVSNYSADGQTSMKRYASLVHEQVCKSNGLGSTLITPPVFFSRLPLVPSSIRKWLGYIDKYLLFPPLLWYHSQAYDLVHICDHSNAIYHHWTGTTPCLITCHDMLAVRGGMGDPSAYCTATWSGRLLQIWILRSLATAPFVAFVSNFSLSDYLRLTKRTSSPSLRVIFSPLNAPFSPDCNPVPLRHNHHVLLQKPYLLMVGSALQRKNREVAISLLAHLGSQWDGLLVIAGSRMTDSQHQLAETYGVSHRIVEVHKPNHDLLNSLYCHAHALLFPSLAEGFGWPIIEAQQCHCPVICSNVTAVPEIAGDGAFICSPDDVQSMAHAVRSLDSSEFRRQLVNAGRENLDRFLPSVFASEYLDFYRYIFEVRQ